MCLGAHSRAYNCPQYKPCSGQHEQPSMCATVNRWQLDRRIHLSCGGQSRHSAKCSAVSSPLMQTTLQQRRKCLGLWRHAAAVPQSAAAAREATRCAQPDGLVGMFALLASICLGRVVTAQPRHNQLGKCLAKGDIDRGCVQARLAPSLLVQEGCCVFCVNRECHG